MNKLSQLSYLAWWFFRARFLGRRKPLQSVVFITSGCDSTCRHCSVCTTPSAYFKSFKEIQQDLDYCYSQGSRMLDVEGVEMLHWKSGTHTINDVFQMAYDKGFYSTSTMIPAADYAQWQKLGVKVDVLWVSILHFSDTSLLENLKDASLYMVINAQNYQEVPAVLEFLQNHKGVQKIAFNFHTPFSGTASMALDHNQRKEVIKQLITYKRKGYRIMNSVSGLKNMLTLNFILRCWICNFIYCDGRRSTQCIDDKSSGICEKCGFSMSGEMNAVFGFKIDTILAGLGIRL